LLHVFQIVHEAEFMKHSAEVYAQFTLSRIKNELKSAPLSDEQQQAVYRALLASESDQRHAVDLRLFIPLLFRSYYLVLFAGQDRRKRTLDIHKIRINRTMRGVLRIFTVSALILLSFLVAAVAFWGLYSLKSSMGIDLIPGFHLTDWVSDTYQRLVN